ncbi:hypothetical protein SEVIR_2G334550v4 [Setaria viridis]
MVMGGFGSGLVPRRSSSSEKRMRTSM